jgi:septum formation protein
MFKEKIILGSASPRRAEILKMAEINFEVHAANVEEIVKPSLSPDEVTIDIARQKMKAIKKHYANKIILTSDTVVVLENDILGKPADAYEAKKMLQRLSGKQHAVITGVVLSKENQEKTFSVTTTVFFKELAESDIDFYIKNYKPFDKAGSYAIQEFIGAIGIEKIEGDYYNVVGLPISRVVEELKGF